MAAVAVMSEKARKILDERDMLGKRETLGQLRERAEAPNSTHEPLVATFASSRLHSSLSRALPLPLSLLSLPSGPSRCVGNVAPQAATEPADGDRVAASGADPFNRVGGRSAISTRAAVDGTPRSRRRRDGIRHPRSVQSYHARPTSAAPDLLEPDQWLPPSRRHHRSRTSCLLCELVTPAVALPPPSRPPVSESDALTPSHLGPDNDPLTGHGGRRFPRRWSSPSSPRSGCSGRCCSSSPSSSRPRPRPSSRGLWCSRRSPSSSRSRSSSRPTSRTAALQLQLQRRALCPEQPLAQPAATRRRV